MAADRVTLAVSMPAADGACPGRPGYRFVPVVVESAQAVGVGLREEFVTVAPGSPGECGRRAILRTESYVVTLATPLGEQVVVDHSSRPVVVTWAELRPRP